MTSPTLLIFKQDHTSNDELYQNYVSQFVVEYAFAETKNKNNPRYKYSCDSLKSLFELLPKFKAYPASRCIV